MALINCPDCNKEVSDSATSCPNCGRPLNQSQSIKFKPAMKIGKAEYIFSLSSFWKKKKG